MEANPSVQCGWSSTTRRKVTSTSLIGTTPRRIMPILLTALSLLSLTKSSASLSGLLLSSSTSTPDRVEWSTNGTAEALAHNTGSLDGVSALPSSTSSTVTASARFSTQHRLVQIYENEKWEFGRGWRRPGEGGRFRTWTYADGGKSVPPQEAQLPDGFQWASLDWKIARDNNTDRAGWCYADHFQSFNKQHRVHRKQSFSDRFRRRRWVRLMRSTHAKHFDDSQQLRDILLPLSVEEGEQGDGILGKKYASDKNGDSISFTSSGLDLLAIADLPNIECNCDVKSILSALSTCRGFLNRLREEYQFKGFAVTLTKSLLHRDIGCGFGIPLTPNFLMWERIDFLPTINSCLGMFFPFCVSGWISFSYPADLVYRFLAHFLPVLPLGPQASMVLSSTGKHQSYTKMMTGDQRNCSVDHYGESSTSDTSAGSGPPSASAFAPGMVVTRSRPKLKKRASVERVGFSVSCRYTRAAGPHFRVTPWLFFLPGKQLVAHLIESILWLMTYVWWVIKASHLPYRLFNHRESAAGIISSTQQPSTVNSTENDAFSSRKRDGRSFKRWVSKKHAGIGYSMNFFRGGLGASLIMSISPFFLKLPPTRLSHSSLKRRRQERDQQRQTEHNLHVEQNRYQ